MEHCKNSIFPPGVRRSGIPIAAPALSKLQIGAVDDPLEREADRATARVMQGSQAPEQSDSAPAR